MKVLTWGIYLVVFCLPMYLVRFKVFGIPTTVLEILIYILFILRLVKGFKFNEFKRLLITHHSLLIAVILILIGVSLATIFSSDLRISAGIWKAWFVDPLLFFIVLISVIKNFEQVKKVLFSLFLSGTAVSIISLVYLILGKLDPVGRLQAFYNSPNYLAMYLAPAFIIGLGFLVFKNPRYHFLGVILLLISLFYAHSYGAWLGIITAVGFGLIIYLFRLRKQKLAWIILGVVLIAVLALGYFALIQRTSSLEARLIIWQKAWQIFKTNPILGIGPGTFRNYFPPYPEWGVPQPHSIYLAFLLQAGILGFIGFILLLIWFFRAGFKLLNANCSVLIVTCIMVYILVHGLVDTTYWKNDLAVIFWLAVGLMTALKKESR